MRLLMDYIYNEICISSMTYAKIKIKTKSYHNGAHAAALASVCLISCQTSHTQRPEWPQWPQERYFSLYFFGGEIIFAKQKLQIFFFQQCAIIMTNWPQINILNKFSELSHLNYIESSTKYLSYELIFYLPEFCQLRRSLLIWFTYAHAYGM